MPTALEIVQKAFPSVTKVVDARKDTEVEVTKRDTTSATVRNHKACAMAVACKRKMDLDGVIMSVSTAYLIKGATATRYKVPSSVSREIVTFDRGAAFEPGEYKLKGICDSQKLDRVRGAINRSGAPTKAKRFHHKTTDIRASLGSKGLV